MTIKKALALISYLPTSIIGTNILYYISQYSRTDGVAP